MDSVILILTKKPELLQQIILVCIVMTALLNTVELIVSKDALKSQYQISIRSCGALAKEEEYCSKIFVAALQ